MTDIDEALKGFARHSADVSGDQDLGDVVMRADRSRRAKGTRVLAALGVAAAVAATVTIVAVLMPPAAVYLRGPDSSHGSTISGQPVATSKNPSTESSLSPLPVTVGPSPSGVGAEPSKGFAACPAPSTMAAHEVTEAFAGHCLVSMLQVEGRATFSPPTAIPPTGSLDAAVALLETAGDDFYRPDRTVTSVLAGFSAVDISAGAPGKAAGGYVAVPGWVLAWHTAPQPLPCPTLVGGQATIDAFDQLPPLGPLENWHFLVVPTDGHVPLGVEPSADICAERAAARAVPVLRHVHPVVDGAGEFTSYPCTKGFGYSGDPSTGRVDLVIGIPVDASVCSGIRDHITGYRRGVTTFAKPGEVRGWPAVVPRP